MFLLRFFRFITGYVIFSGTGGFPERFINLCAMNGIGIWDARTSDGTLTAKTSIACYKRIRRCARRSGMKLKVSRKCGLPFIIKPYINRKGLLAGAVLSVVIVSVLSSCVWTVTVSGNVKFTDEQILSLAKSYGIRPGVFRSTVDAKAVREDIKANIDGISWFSVNTDGTAVSVEVMESTGGNEILDLTTPCNIVSSADGELIKLEVYTGEAAIATGNAVTKGDLLISGVVERADGSSDFVRARGNAVVRTKREITKTVPDTAECKTISQIKNRYSLSVFSINIPLGKIKQSGLNRTEKAMLSFSGLTLPLGIITDSSADLTQETVTLNESRSSLLCAWLVFTEEKEIMKNAETEEKTVHIGRTDKGTTVTMRYINHEKCGIENYFIVEDN